LEQPTRAAEKQKEKRRLEIAIYRQVIPTGFAGITSLALSAQNGDGRA
jgi:hypothetical protein